MTQETITVFLNKREYNIPRTVQTVSELLSYAGYATDSRLYRVVKCESCGNTHTCDEELEGHIIIGELDSFQVFPLTINGG